MAVPGIGQLAVKFSSVGAIKAGKDITAVNNSFGKMARSMKGRLVDLTKKWAKFGAVASGAFFIFLKSSPRLRAELDLLRIRVNALVRPFADELAPIIRIVSDSINDLTKWFKSLPPPIQKATTAGFAFTVALGLIAAGAVVVLAALNPIVLTFAAIVVGLALLVYAWETNFLHIQEITILVTESINTHFAGTTKAIENSTLLMGGYMKGMSVTFQTTANTIIDAVLFIPLALLDIAETIATDVADNFFDAGWKLIDALLAGMKTRMDAAGGEIYSMIEEGISQYLGGSLPEKGPLKNIVIMGESLAIAYVGGMESGLKRTRTGDVINRTFNIDRIELAMTGVDTEKRGGFLERLDSDIRRATSI